MKRLVTTLYASLPLLRSPLCTRSSSGSFSQSTNSPEVDTVLPSLHRNYARRQSTYFLILLGISLLTAYQSYRPSTSSLATPHVLPPTFVAPRRRFAPDGKSLYTDCSVDEVLEALRTAVVREDGASRFPNFTKPTSVALPSFEWSFDFGALESGKTCKPLRYYDPQEACEAMSAFGGCVFSLLFISP